MKFHAGNFSLDNASWLGTPVEVNTDQIEKLIENNQHYTTWEVADILKISKSTKLLVKMKNMSFTLWKKLSILFGQPNSIAYTALNILVSVLSTLQCSWWSSQQSSEVGTMIVHILEIRALTGLSGSPSWDMPHCWAIQSSLSSPTNCFPLTLHCFLKI